jgi:hypothetical protein
METRPSSPKGLFCSGEYYTRDNTYKDCYIRQECFQLGAFRTSIEQNRGVERKCSYVTRADATGWVTSCSAPSLEWNYFIMTMGPDPKRPLIQLMFQCLTIQRV